MVGVKSLLNLDRVMNTAHLTFVLSGGLLDFSLVQFTQRKYENKEKHCVYTKTLMQKNHGNRKKLHYEYKKITYYSGI